MTSHHLRAWLAAAAIVPAMSLAANTNDGMPTPDGVIAIDDIKRGTTVSVQGKVERIMDTDEFRLSDASGDVVVYVGYRNMVPVKVGETVVVDGFVDDDFFVEIYARQITHQDGRVTTLMQ